jgi:uncharacterized protein (TIGR02246 family)
MTSGARHRPRRDISEMSEDERAIRDLVATWMAASESGDLATVLSLMAEDVLFMVPGREPFGRQAFASAAQGMKEVRIEGRSDIQELEILDGWAWMRNRLEMTMTPAGGGTPVRRAGCTLTILRKRDDGRWVIARDANLLS